MKETITNEFDVENEEVKMMCLSDDNPKEEQPRPDEDDGSVGTGGKEEDEKEDIKPYN
ncbi:MAG: hypothetical protein AAF617_10095 [Bacteroidota bacterium]